jgi:uncharacterized protein (DUF2249 family)
METSVDRIDLRLPSGITGQLVAWRHLKDLKRGDVKELMSDEEPSLLMESLTLRLDYRISWELIESGPPLWRVRVCYRDGMPPGSLLDLMMHDHERVPAVLASALYYIKAGFAEMARPYIHELLVLLRRHIHIENDILAPMLMPPRDAAGLDPTSAMLREHEEILAQVTALETRFVAAPPDSVEVIPVLSAFSATLARHEAHEEREVLPQWERAIAKAPRCRRDALGVTITTVLNGGDDYLLF